MELSKKRGPYKYTPHTYYELLVDGEYFLSCRDKDKAEEMIKRWNEHDTLKAKEALLDEIKSCYRKAYGGYSSGWTLGLMSDVDDIMKKYEALSK